MDQYNIGFVLEGATLKKILMLVFVSFFIYVVQLHAALPFLAAQSNPPTLAPMLEKILPGVVNISIRTKITIQDNPLFSDPFFRRFFNVPDTPR